MPLYKKRSRQIHSQLHSSQNTESTRDGPKVKTLKVSSINHQRNGSQTAIDDILNTNKNLRSPIYPESLTRTASEPNESAFSESEIFDESYTSITSTSKTLNEKSKKKCSAERKSEEIDINLSLKNTTISENIVNISPKITKDERNEKSSESHKKLHKEKTKSIETVKHKISPDQTHNELCSIKNQNSFRNDTLPESLNASLNSSIHSRNLNLSDRQYDDLLNLSLNTKLNDSGNDSFSNTKKKVVSKIGPHLSQKSDISMSDPVVKNAYMKFMKNKERFYRLPTPKDLEHKQKLKWLQQQRNVGVFVHCDKCDKIRYLDDIKDPLLLPKKWYCKNNPDVLHNKCENPEEKFPAHVQEDWIDNEYNAGSLVWARLEGFPWWPAIVDDDPDTECYYWLDDEFNNTPVRKDIAVLKCQHPKSYYNVTFFDKNEVSRAWLKPDALKPFTENIDKLKQNYYSFKDRIEVAIKQAKEASEMPLLTRLETFSFVARYKKSINKPRNVKLDVKNKMKKRDVTVDAATKGKRNKILEKRNRKIIKRKRIINTADSYEQLFGDMKLPSSPSLSDISLELFDDV